ncbi:DUF6596 domain-containing protein [Nocardioides euryhalodurans]|uniref:Uncharacterized protein n=1 Tax=Nocardioides euryhalodurans TaxID=2518370 RepID=A0A4P7GPU5_9ACTN|nr:DUF6596 domain-containing protein [Nocardioides euryhalodurans]QBR94143.1 hypothetical protein EXE57_19015 [Nocardioides euryhalodurans]
MTVDPEAFRTAWPQVVRALAVATRSLDLGEEYAAEAFGRAAAQPEGSVRDLAAWCVRVGRHAWLDDVRRRQRLERLEAELATADGHTPTAMDSGHLPGEELDDRLALLFVACDDALAPGAQLVLAMRVVCGLSTRQIADHLGIAEATAAARLTRAKAALARARGEFAVPDEDGRRRRLPVVLACVAGLLTAGQREVVAPRDATDDPARDALTLAEALAAEHPQDPDVLGLRAVCRLALGRRPGRVRDGVALPLDQVHRSAWDQDLLTAGLDDAARAARTARGAPGRFVLEAAISGVHATAPSSERTDWDRLAQLYDALVEVWPSPAVAVARLVVAGRRHLRDGTDPADVEAALEELVADGPTYAARDAGLALADLAFRTGRRQEAAGRYRELLDVVPEGPLREFCRRRSEV